MSVQQQASRFHPLPVIGHPDIFYVKQIESAERAGDVHALESQKVGRYITLAMDPAMPWEEKLRHLLHAMKRHCTPVEGAAPDVQAFYQRLADLVRRHAGQEALRFLAKETASLRLRQQTSDPAVLRQQVAELRKRVVGDTNACPRWMTQEAWDQVSRLLARLV